MQRLSADVPGRRGSTRRRRGSVAGEASLLVVSLGLVLSCGCARSDVLVGSWKPVDARGDGYGLVIAKDDTGYRLALAGAEGLRGWTPLERRGRRLVGTPHLAGGPLGANLEIRLTFIWDNGRLRYEDTSGLMFSLFKVSDSTMKPSPVGEPHHHSRIR